jgi:UDP-glucose 4-epimerase
MRILLTGGAGYIGSHTAVSLASVGHEVVCFDNLANSRPEVIARLEEIAARAIPLIIGDVRDRVALEDALDTHQIEAVIHCAGLKAVGESGEKPLLYYDNNVQGTLCLLQAMAATGVRHLVFSSSATVYGEPQYLPLDEGHPTGAANPYGRTKLMVEEMLADVVAADASWRIAVLRYFNPVGAHPSGLIGEDPNGIPNNLMPFIARVASGRLERLSIFGNDYPTPDGTGVRDYIHVMDLAEGHVAALQTSTARSQPLSVWNLGTGTGYSVLEMVAAFEQVTGKAVPYTIAPRRPGDVAICYASPDRAHEELGWQARFGLLEMCASTWRFECQLHTTNRSAGAIAERGARGTA